MKAKPKTTESSAPASSFWQQRKGDAIVLLTALATVGVIAHIISGGSIGIVGEWTWRPYSGNWQTGKGVEPGGNWVPLVVVSVLFIAAAGWLTRPNRWEKTSHRLRAVWLVILVLLAWALSLSFIMTRVKPVAFTAAVMVSPQATSYFTVGASLPNLSAALRDYPSLMKRLPQHARTHPPGPIVFFWTVDRIVRHVPGLAAALETAFRHVDPEGTKTFVTSLDILFNARIAKTDVIAAVFSAIILALLGSLTLIPLYLLGSALYKPATALHACMLFIVVPSFLLFAPSIDQLVLLLSVFTLWSFHLLRARGNPIVGFIFALAMLMSLGSAIIGVLLLLWWALDQRTRINTAPSPNLSTADNIEQAASVGTAPVKPTTVAPPTHTDGGCSLLPSFPRAVLLAAGIFLLTFIVLRATLGLDFIAIIRAGLSAHRDITVNEAQRTYWKWVVYNPVEFAVFLGMPVVIWALVGLRGRSATSLRATGFTCACVGALLLLDISGSVRAEVGRIWLFLMPPATLLAANQLAQLGKRFDLGYFAALVLQLGQAVAMKAALDIFILK